MVIQHNIQALNTFRQLNIVSSSQSKSAEKLSSGYRINRSADDASGLSISEKMRKQIRGLTQAGKNAEDGISYVQIADGALEEVAQMLQRGNELAVKAANGTLSDSDRRDVNAELEHLKTEINSINEKSLFSNIRVFAEEGNSLVSVSKAQQGIIDVVANEFVPTVISQMKSSLSSISSGLSAADASKSNEDAFAITLQMKFIDGEGGTLAYMSSGFYYNNPGKDTFAEDTLVMDLDTSDFSSATYTDKDKQVLQSTVAHELMHGVMDILMPEGMYGDDSADSGYNFPLWFKEGCAQLIGGGYTTGWNDSLMYIEGQSGDDTSKINAVKQYLKDGSITIGNFTISGGGTYTVEGRPYGHGYLACAYLCQLASGAGVSNVSLGSLQSGANKIFNALMAGGNYSDTFENVINGQISSSGKNLNSVISEMNNGGEDAAKFVHALTKASYNTDTLYGSGSIIASSLSDPFVLGNTVTDKQVLFVKEDNSKNSSKSLDQLSLHIGADADWTNSISLQRYCVTTETLGISDTNLLTENSATVAIFDMGQAIKAVSAVRSYYGAVQNRLEHTVKNLDNVVENTTASESKIRDTDMAKEMILFSNSNILSQAGQSMLAQANQSKDMMLSMFG